MIEGMDVLLALRRLRWLGHMGRMEADRLPKQILFGELLSARPFHGLKLRWRDVVLRDLRIIGFDANLWYRIVVDGMMLAKPLPLEVFLLLVALLSSLDHLFVNVAECLGDRVI